MKRTILDRKELNPFLLEIVIDAIFVIFVSGMELVKLEFGASMQKILEK